MRTWRIPIVLGGLGIVLAPAVGDAAVVYRASGAACQPSINGTALSTFSPESGLALYGPLSPIVCSLPTSDTTFTPSTLTKVNVRYFIGGEANVTARLIFHDFDSNDYVECDETSAGSAKGHGLLELYKNCSSSSYESSWAVVPALHTDGLSSVEFLRVKLITAYD
ncbi:MAG TPA: hypothetical protein VI197_29650 [Polyangiaceae bacterium]